MACAAAVTLAAVLFLAPSTAHAQSVCTNLTSGADQANGTSSFACGPNAAVIGVLGNPANPVRGTAIGDNATAGADQGTAVGYSAQVFGASGTAIGQFSYASTSSTALGSGSEAIGTQAVAIGTGDNNNINDFTNIYGARDNNATAVGFAAIAGRNSTALGQGAIAGGLGSVALGKDSIAVSDNTVSVGNAGAGGQRRIVNVAAGTFSANSTDAVNGGQLYSIISGLPFDSNNAANAAITSANGANASALGYGANASAAGAVALGNSSTASAANAVALGTGSVANLANTVSVGAVGSERRIVNVADGTIGIGSTDAITGGQLMTANQRVATAFGGGAGLDINGQLTAPSYTIQGAAYNNVGSALTAVNATVAYTRVNSSGPAANASGADAIAVGSNAQATQAGSIAVGLNASSTGTNAIAIGTGAVAIGSIGVGAGATASNGGAAFGDGATATGTNSAALGTNASATAANAVAIGSGSTNTVANTVSFGSAGGERRLTNVAAGISQTDAVNVGQLQSVAAGFSSQMSGLQSQINDSRWEARGGVALALAASGLRYDDRPGKLSMAGAFGNFKGESGLAFGLGYAATERLRFNASVSGVPSQGSVGGVVSGSITLN